MRLAGLVALLALLLPSLAGGRELVDLAGRKVAVPDKIERIIIGEGRYLPALAILDRADPVARLVGMMGEYEAVDPVSYQRYRERFPALDRVKRIGRNTRDTFSIEQAITVSPQVAIFSLYGHGPDPRSDEVIRALEAAGVAILFIDFRSDPLVNTPKSIELLGALLGREAEAAEFVAVWRAALAVITDRLAAARPKPARVFIESRVGLGTGCCETMTRGMMGRFVTAAGGVNIADDLVPGEAGVVNLEWLMSNPPEVYIGTAVGNAQQRDDAPWLALGPGMEAGRARALLARSMTRTGIGGLDAVQHGRAHAVWHHFYNSPFNVVAVQAFAQWLHPQLFADLDPKALLATMQQRFQPVPLDGTYWTSLR